MPRPTSTQGQDHGLRDRVAGAGGRDQAGIDGFEGGDAPFHAAARVDHGDEHHDGGENHDHALDGVREHHGPEAAHGGVQDDREPEQRQPDDVGIAGHGLKEPRPSDELGQHGRHEEDQQGQRAEDDHGVAAVAGAQEVGQERVLRAMMAKRLPSTPSVRKVVGTWIMASRTQLRPSL